ncbi:MAG: hypothetical protein B7Z50_02970, partial [Sphingomonadales bacterium 12-62-5]
LPSGDAFGGSMAEVVAEGTSFLTDADREAIATYLLDPAGGGDITSPTPPAAEAAPPVKKPRKPRAKKPAATGEAA